jgi:hypothetical protein
MTNASCGCAVVDPNNKPVVTFRKFLGIEDSSCCTVALLGGVVGHPVLGEAEIVRTSRVARIEYNEDGTVKLIETRNTLYTKE